MTNFQALYEINKLSPSHNKINFSSGNSILDNYLKNQAGQDIKKNVAVTYILSSLNSSDVIGYYTLSSISVDISELPEEFRKKAPRYPVLPSVLIGRLAVDSNYQKKKLGEYLLMDAFKRSMQISDQIGINAVIVDSKDETAAKFYCRYGFNRFPRNKLKLFIPIKVIKLLNL